MENRLFAEFTADETKDKWLKTVTEELKGAEFEKIVWKTYENLHVDPYYKQQDIQNLPHLNNQPGEFPFVRSNKPTKDSNNWCVRQSIAVTDYKTANELAKIAVAKGVDSLGFRFAKEIRSGKLNEKSAEWGISLNTQQEFAALLDGIDLTKISINFCAESASLPIFAMIINEAKRRAIDLSKITGSIDNDPIKELALLGVLCEKRFEDMSRVFEKVINKMPNFKAAVVNSHYYHESGASIVQELAFTLATAVEYINKLNTKFSVEEICRHLSFSLSVGSSYLPEIAKFRAFRLLWSDVIKGFGAKPEVANAKIHAKTSAFNKTVFDTNVNILRTTTEAMAAVIGGCNSLTVMPFDDTIKEADEFSQHIARNIQYLLKEEANFDKVVDPAGGSYYVEKLTDSIAKEAWTLFQEVEKQGGIVEAFRNGFVQAKIAEVRALRDKNFTIRRDVLVGTNQYPNTQETVTIGTRSKSVEYKEMKPLEIGSDLIDSLASSLNNGSSLTDAVNGMFCASGCCRADYTSEKLVPTRIAQKYENLRMHTQEFAVKAGKKPTAFLATLGGVTMRRARASFAMNFLGTGGFEIIDNNGFASVDEAVEAAVKSNAEIAVICAADEEYKEFAPEFTKKFKAQRSAAAVLVAGNPVEIIALLKEAGVDDFIHIKANPLTTIEVLQKKLGM